MNIAACSSSPVYQSLTTNLLVPTCNSSVTSCIPIRAYPAQLAALFSIFGRNCISSDTMDHKFLPFVNVIPLYLLQCLFSLTFNSVTSGRNNRPLLIFTRQHTGIIMVSTLLHHEGGHGFNPGLGQRSMEMGHCWHFPSQWASRLFTLQPILLCPAGCR